MSDKWSKRLDRSSKNLDGSSKEAVMADAVLAQQLLREAFPPREGENVKSRIARAARALGITYRRARAIWYGEARRIEFREMEAIKNAQAATLAARAARLRASLAAIDPDLSQQEIDALRRIERRARQLAGEDCPA